MRRQLGRFVVVGAVNTATYYAIYLALVTALPYLVAHLTAFCCAMVISFFANCYYTYRTRPTLRKFLLFPLTNLANLAISTGVLFALVAGLGLAHRLAPIVAALAPVPVTFLLSRWILTGRRRYAADARASRPRVGRRAPRPVMVPRS